MRTELRISESHWNDLSGALLRDGREQAALLLCGYVGTTDHQILMTREVVVLQQEDYLDRGDLHLSVAPEALARVAKRARLSHATVVLVHSHPFGDPVAASRLDLTTEEDLCGRVLAARLAPRPVGALVLGKNSFDGRLWTDSGSRRLDAVRVVGERMVSFGNEIQATPIDQEERVSRQQLAWGSGGQVALSRAHVAIVGVGGTGSHVAMQLAHLGVGRLTLVDPDTVERTNLSRLVGATEEDVGERKVDVVARHCRAINPRIAVAVYAESVLDTDPRLLAVSDIVVCATDGHGSRALITELVQQYLLPCVDLGVEIQPGASSVAAGGGVRVLLPARWCLHCAGTLDPALIREEYLTDDARALELKRGYIRGASEPAPSVIALNGVVASMAVLEICHMLAGFLSGFSGRVLYRAERRSVTTAAVVSDPGCFVCGVDGLLGLGDGRWPGIRGRSGVA